MRELIQQELVKALKSDDVLKKLNEEARQKGISERDESAIQEMQSEVARLLRIHGLDVGQAVGGQQVASGFSAHLENGQEPFRLASFGFTLILLEDSLAIARLLYGPFDVRILSPHMGSRADAAHSGFDLFLFPIAGCPTLGFVRVGISILRP